MNVRTLRLSTLGACLLALGAVALNTSGDAGSPSAPPLPPPPPPVMIVCGDPPLQETHCYTSFETTSWLYQNAGTEALAVDFSSLILEGWNYDNLTIYDGVDNTAPVLYSQTDIQFGLVDLSGLIVTSTGPNMFMQASSDGSVDCGSQSIGYTPWMWTVSCLDCTAPAATFDIDLNCDLSFFNVVVDITAIGSDPSIDILNTGGAPTVTATAPGQYIVGPFTPGQEVEVTLENELNSLCNVESGLLTNSPCPLISCGPNTYDYCYANDDVYTVVYQGNTTFPLRLQFNSGGIYQFDGDLLTIYDGLNDLAPVLYSGTGVNGDLTGIFVTSTNPDHALTLKMTSTQFTGCADGNA